MTKEEALYEGLSALFDDLKVLIRDLGSPDAHPLSWYASLEWELLSPSFPPGHGRLSPIFVKMESEFREILQSLIHVIVQIKSSPPP